MILNGAYVLRFVSFIIILHQRKELKVTTKTEKACKAASINNIVRVLFCLREKRQWKLKLCRGAIQFCLYFHNHHIPPTITLDDGKVME